MNITYKHKNIDLLNAELQKLKTIKGAENSFSSKSDRDIIFTTQYFPNLRRRLIDLSENDFNIELALIKSEISENDVLVKIVNQSKNHSSDLKKFAFPIILILITGFVTAFIGNYFFEKQKVFESNLEQLKQDRDKAVIVVSNIKSLYFEFLADETQQYKKIELSRNRKSLNSIYLNEKNWGQERYYDLFKKHYIELDRLKSKSAHYKKGANKEIYNSLDKAINTLKELASCIKKDGFNNCTGIKGSYNEKYHNFRTPLEEVIITYSNAIIYSIDEI